MLSLQQLTKTAKKELSWLKSEEYVKPLWYSIEFQVGVIDNYVRNWRVTQVYFEGKSGKIVGSLQTKDREEKESSNSCIW